MVKVGFPGGPRLEWYDRNPQSKNLNFEGSVGPHAAVDRASYTVPTGKKFFLENSLVHLDRDVVATTPGWASVRTFARDDLAIYASIRSNAVGDKAAMNIARSLIMRAGEAVRINSFDLSTGGTIRYDCAFHGIEFDA